MLRQQSTSTKVDETEKDSRIISFQKYLTELETLKDTTTHIRAFVGSNDFVQVLTACGTPDTPPRVKSLAFMILTRLLNPSNATDYPMTYIIEQCAACFSHCIDKGKNDTKLLAYHTLNAIFQTNMTVGSAILCQEGCLEEIMDVIDFEILPVQKAIAEVLIIASSDKSCQKQILKYATDWLAKMASQTKVDPELKSAAGTALTKLRAQSDVISDDASNTQTTHHLEEAMRKMNITDHSLIDSLKQVIKSKSPDTHVILNAVEGLAYSSLKPEVKASLGNDEEFLKSLSTLAISASREETTNNNPLLFGIGTIFANLTMYRPVLDEQQKQMKKLRDLANAKQRKATKENEEDPRENDSAVEERIKKAIANGVAIALMVLSKNKSMNIRLVAAKTYLQLVTPQSTRGQLLQQGIVKSLLSLSRDTTETGITASQALAKLAITTDPRIAFQGDTILDLVRPFLNLCKDANSQLRQFEGLMALTNLASVDDRVRLMIENAGGVAIFENLQLSNHDMVQRAATEMICNMTFCEPVFELYSDPNKSQNRIRLLMILSDHEDPATRRAASGALAILANSPSTCEMILKVDKCYERISRWLEIDETADVQHRGIEVIRCLIQHKGSDVIDNLVKENIDKKLVILVKQCKLQIVQSAAMEVLKLLMSHGVQMMKA
ncbi:armadillo-type protein [Cokeromyces recurvatus]|uniref:armadillo-type protein n=1 Tax=Cokeromyces recurvatus TaxID=90255 RepID=UPI002220E12C|nr:armadillo-type protein [Cokeromyces recurvatus]KAI7899836.1 armadillo-type protein [Cokeromyces recurvatus]